MSESETPARAARRAEMLPEQLGLFGEIDARWREHWWGMPSFDMNDARPAHRIVVNFHTWEDVVSFADRLGVRVTRRTDSLFFPPEDVSRPNEWEFVDE